MVRISICIRVSDGFACTLDERYSDKIKCACVIIHLLILRLGFSDIVLELKLTIDQVGISLLNLLLRTYYVAHSSLDSD